MSSDAPAEVESISRLAQLFSRSDRILVFTGAGISTASGIPDYRGPQGVWTTRTPVFYDDFMGSIEARRRYWTQKMEDREAFGAAAPNRVHAALVALEAAGKVEMVVTQNVDGLHAAAGTSPERLVELHGTARSVECQSCGRRSEPGAAFDSFRATSEPPVCECGGWLKPATISFGQSLKTVDLHRAFEAAGTCDLVVALGSTLTVTPAADVPLRAARRGVPYVIVNRGSTEHDRYGFISIRIDADVSEIVPPAVELALGGR